MPIREKHNKGERSLRRQQREKEEEQEAGTEHTERGKERHT